jgi:hypothetical protein
VNATDEELRAVLDTSAMLSYARPHVHVGELISEIAQEGAYVAVPTVALLDAYAQLMDDELGRARLGVLVTLEGVRLIPLDQAGAVKVSTAVPLADGDLSRAHTLQVALANRAYYVTTDPKTAPAILGGRQVHAVPEYDAPN